jgi:hypothetical protein
MCVQVALAAEYYVAPNATADGSGTRGSPWTLATALAHPPGVRPGDTIWLRGGTYHGGFKSTLAGTAELPIVVRTFPGERVTIDTAGGAGAAQNGDPYFRVHGCHTWYVGFRIMCSDPGSRISIQTGSTPAVRRGGIHTKGDNNSFINLVVHDLDAGPGMWGEGAGGLLYGCVIYNNGWLGPDRGHGHGVYVQNEHGIKVIAENIIFNQFGSGIHAFGSQKAHLRGLRFVGNVIFNSGGAQGGSQPAEREILVGGATPASDIRLTENFTYQNRRESTIDLGFLWGKANEDIKLVGNHFVSNVTFRQPWARIVATGNTFISGQGRLFSVALPENHDPADFTWDGNRYVTEIGKPFAANGRAMTWSQWRQETGFDAQSEQVTDRPGGTFVAVRRNNFQPGRGHVVVFNWDRKPTVSVDLSDIVKKGAQYEMHHVLDLFGQPVSEGVFDGKLVEVAIEEREAPRPVGYTKESPAGTTSEFAAFLVTSAE